MFKNKFTHVIESLNNPAEYNIDPYRRTLKEVDRIKLNSRSDCQLRELAMQLRKQARLGFPVDSLLPESFALVREVAKRVIGMFPFDVQVMAGIALHKGKIVEMQTGEGKTLAAVMPAYLNALTGKGVHVLTFNDYLAGRDANWMGPIFKFLGLTVTFVTEGMGTAERQQSYASDITYLTAKEAGFDYLRDFLCMKKQNLVHRPFHYAIVDEADSILIDEARIPLVIAGEVPEGAKNHIDLARMVRELKPGTDYEIDQYQSNLYLTDAGLLWVEEILGCGNLYEQENLDLLTRLNCALYAEVLVERDKHYVVRSGKIEIIDEFTGRIADKRHWPDNLQAAVEAKEGLCPQSSGMVMGSIAVQHFLRLYPKISGMTGTARTAAEEFRGFYAMDVVVIPTNKPCIRKDHPDLVFTHKEAKQRAVLREIKRVHKTGQPVLLGTGSVEESEWIAAELSKAGVKCQVLNARNHAMEASIIAKAGEPGAVTVSTNMAGRGVDIKLGGETEREREKVVELGGLYVVGTSRYESRRIDNQLRGRAGRQGDPGESRFFISLEDDLVKKYEIAQLIPAWHIPQRKDEPVDDPLVRRALARGQRIVDGYNSDLRRQLWKYSLVLEQQRRIIHSKRQEILMDELSLQLLAAEAPERYVTLCSQIGTQVLSKVEKQLTLYYINKCWADYLDYISYVREGIHLVVLGRKNPLDEFHKTTIEAFDAMLKTIDSEVVRKFNSVEIKADGIDLDKEGVKGPASTWTYLINDSPDQFTNLSFFLRAAGTALSRPLVAAQSLYNRLFLEKKEAR